MTRRQKIREQAIAYAKDKWDANSISAKLGLSWKESCNIIERVQFEEYKERKARYAERNENL